MANGWSELTTSFKEHRGGNRRKKKSWTLKYGEGISDSTETKVQGPSWHSCTTFWTNFSLIQKKVNYHDTS